jgi:hypothetical protein
MGAVLRAVPPKPGSEATGYEVAWIISCDEGYSSSLAAASLRTLSPHQATDLADASEPGAPPGGP